VPSQHDWNIAMDSEENFQIHFYYQYLQIGDQTPDMIDILWQQLEVLEQKQ
jgi:hypothetical protein